MLYTADAERVFTSTNDLSTKQYFIVKLDASNANQVVLAAAATDKFIGVLMDNPKALDRATVRMRSAQGTFPVVAGGTINIGDAVTSNASGQAITTTTGSDQILGTAVVAAVSGDVFEVMPSTGKV